MQILGHYGRHVSCLAFFGCCAVLERGQEVFRLGTSLPTGR